jgi:peroxiredoxin-like protein
MGIRSKSLEFPVGVEWAGGKRVRAYVPGKPMIEIAMPPEFKGDSPGIWSPEDFLVGAVASCYSVTMVAIAERRQIPLYDLAVEAVGRIGAREDGGFGFQAIELEVAIETDHQHLEVAHDAAERAERGCLVSLALRIPVEVELDVCAVEPATMAAAGSAPSQ